MEMEMKRMKRVRAGHKTFVKKVMAEAKGVTQRKDQQSRQGLRRFKLTLTEQLEAIAKLDSDILEAMNEGEETEEEALVTEIEEAAILRADIDTAIHAIVP